ncbi:hypothetical protein OG906_39540 (plasmid) [Streptomyces sp. NBC_01426]|uniref:hypothetical protein n=1 Tax=Streptomyces sp. NBC_01426 TaxID=2975866 RepID=UPI002E359159|nr:hypothetical protein [Streptomyces sp. NBC_01426]
MTRLARLVAHHAMKVLLLTIPPWVVLLQIKDLHWAALVGVSALTLVLAAAALALSFHLPDCPLCVHRTAAELRKIRYRIPLYCAHLVGPLLMAAVLFLFLAPAPRTRQYTDLDALRTVRISATLIALVLVVAAVQFRRRNAEALARPWWSGALSALDRASKTAGHYTHWVLIGACAILVPYLVLVPHTGPWEAIRWVVMLIALGAGWAEMNHAGALCARCTIGYDLNRGMERAESGRRYLLLDHRLTVPPVVWLCVVATAGASNLLFEQAALYLMAFLFLLAIPKTILSRFHNRHLPWCPICSRGDGGDDGEEVPAPDSPGGLRLPLPSV